MATQGGLVARAADRLAWISRRRKRFGAIWTAKSRAFHGWIWLFYTNRPLHWDYVRVEDSKLWQNYFWNRDCRPDLYIRFANLGLTPMSCAGLPMHKSPEVFFNNPAASPWLGFP